MDMHELMKEINDPNSQYYVPKEDFEFIPVKGTKAGVKSRNGHLVPILCRNLSVVKNMEVREDDTFVITFPKSGTHWIGEICWLIQNNLDFERAQKDSYMKRCPFIDVGIPDGILKKVPSPRVFRTHLQHELLPHDIHRKSKIVYAVRNPKDVLVSLYYFLQTIPQDEYEGSFEDLFNSFVEGKHMCGPWWEHVNMFTRLENVYVVHYEDMIKDAVNEVRSLAKFLGKELNDEQIKSIVDFSSFDNLKERIGQDMRIPPNFLKFVDAIPDPNAKTNDDQSNSSNNQPPMPRRPVMLFRKGVIGDWKNHLSEDMSKMLDDIVKHKVNYPKPFIYEHN